MKYPKITGYYVYMHRTPEKDCYFGISQQQPTVRFAPSHYKGTTLLPYIEKFGWDNIEHKVLFDNLTKRQAEIIEDWLITNARRDGFCINKRRSGGIERDNPEGYNQSPEVKERQRQYNSKRRKTEDYKKYQHEYHQTEKYKAYQREYQREYQRQYRLKKQSTQ